MQQPVGEPPLSGRFPVKMLCFGGKVCYTILINEELRSFAQEVKKYVPQVMFTVVDIIGEDEIKRSQKVADSVGIHLRVREMITD